MLGKLQFTKRLIACLAVITMVCQQVVITHANEPTPVVESQQDDSVIDNTEKMSDPENEDETPIESESSVSETNQTPTYPAIGFTKTLSDGTTLEIHAPEGAFPQGVALAVSKLAGEQVVNQIQQVSGQPVAADELLVYDFDFYLGEQHRVEPLVPISVTVHNESLKSEKRLSLYHLKSTTDVAEEKQVQFAYSQNGSVRFVADEFSLYALRAASTSTGTIMVGNPETGVEATSINDAVAKLNADASLDKKIYLMGGTFSEASGNLAAVVGSTIPAGIELIIYGDTTITGTGSETGITLNGSSIHAENGATLSMSGFKSALILGKNALLKDGNYILSGNGVGLNVQAGAKVEGTSREALSINIANSSGDGLVLGNNVSLIKATIYAEAVDNKDAAGTPNGRGGNFTLRDASLETKYIFFAHPIQVLEGSNLYIHAAFHDYRYWGFIDTHLAWTLQYGPSEISGGSTVTIDGGRITLAWAGLTIKDSTMKFVNSDGGGINISNGNTLTLDNATLIQSNGKKFPLFGAQKNSHIVFKNNSVVDTDGKSTQMDNGGAENGSTFEVTGGSYNMVIPEGGSFSGFGSSGTSYPTNGEDNGNERLSLLTLKDSAMSLLEPMNLTGSRYEYPVERANADGKKRVFAPAVTVEFDLNNDLATYSDGSTGTKTMKTIRGYSLNLIEGNDDPTPKDGLDSKGNQFLGWYLEDGTPFTWDTVLTSTSADPIKVVASWDGKPVRYHDGRQGTSEQVYEEMVAKLASSSKVLSYDELVKTKPDFQWPGKRFIGWNTKADGTGTTYQAGDDLPLNETEATDLYAQYEDVHYTIRFSANGGVFADDSIFKAEKTRDLFTIETDENGGEIATVKKTALYNQRLNNVLSSGIPEASLSIASKIGWKVYGVKGWFGSTYYWYVTDSHNEENSYSDYSNPAIQEDMTFYLKWTSATEKNYTFNTTLTGDLASGELDSSEPRLVKKGDSFPITGRFYVDPVLEQMNAIQALNEFKDLDPNEISLHYAQSTFTASLILPKGIQIVSEPDYEVTGLGDAFDVSDPVVTKNADGTTKVVVTFKLKSGIKTFGELKEKLETVGTSQVSARRRAARSAEPARRVISVTLDGLSYMGNPDATTDPVLVANGEVNGNFSATAEHEGTIANFAMNYTSEQDAEGRDSESTNTAIRYTFKTPLPLALPGDMLIGEDTEHDGLHTVYRDHAFDFTGTLDVSLIKAGMKQLYDDYGQPDNVTTSGVQSVFTSKLTLPKGLSFAKDLTARFTGADNLFKLEGIQLDENDPQTAIVTLKLKKEYTSFMDLYNDVQSADKVLKVIVPAISVDQEVEDGMQLTAHGSVEGYFVGTASRDGVNKYFNYSWHAVQTDDGKDFILKDSPSSDIQYTVVVSTPSEITSHALLEADILVGEDTEHDAIKVVKPGDKLDFTGRLMIDPIQKQIDQLKNNFSGDSSQIQLDQVKSTFTATLKLPNELIIPEKIEASFSDDEVFKLDSVSVEGHTVKVVMSLKKIYTNFNDLHEDIMAMPEYLDTTIYGIQVSDQVNDGQKLKVLGTVEGEFSAFAYFVNGLGQNVTLSWHGVQLAEGKDFTQEKDDNETIAYTMEVQLPKKAVKRLGKLHTGVASQQSMYIIGLVGAAILLAALVIVRFTKHRR